MTNRSRFRIFDYCWHTPHQFDMVNALQNECDFSYCLTSFMHWDGKQRPKPQGINFVTHYEPGKYDLAILHLDQRCIIGGTREARIYSEFNEIIRDIPKIVINHGTPVFPEANAHFNNKFSSLAMEAEIRAHVRKLVGTNTMVVNSHTAATKEEWGFGIPIVHGMNPENWLDLPKEPRIFTALPLQGRESYYNRICMLAAGQYLYNQYGYILSYANYNIQLNHSFDAYRNYLGRSLLYLDTSVRTPMNRARSEAFLSGCCVIQVERAHDLDRWAKNKENIILTPNDPKEIARRVADLLENKYEEALHIGQKGRLMAIKQFDPERYRREWLTLINSLIHR